jgi:sugar phosphate isomerase/epimerase
MIRRITKARKDENVKDREKRIFFRVFVLSCFRDSLFGGTDTPMSLETTRSPCPLAAFATSLPGDLAAVLGQIAELGFTHVDLVAEVDRPAEHREALADSGLLVSCLALGRNLPAGHTLDAADVGVRRATLALLQLQVADASRLGAMTVYLVPPPLSPPNLGGNKGGDATGLTYFAEGCALLADYAAARKVRLCVEHVPGRALPDAATTLDWLEQLSHPHLGLLLDVGHCLISGEDAAAVVRRAGQRLGYVHLDDNDGAGDLHWPLLTGRLTEPQLADTMRALQAIGYRGALSLELNPTNADPVEALRDGKRIVERMIRGD